MGLATRFPLSLAASGAPRLRRIILSTAIPRRVDRRDRPGINRPAHPREA